MPREFKRTDRIAQVIQRELASLLQKGVKDPRLSPLVTITAVEVTRDLAYAKIFIMLYNDDETVINNNLKILNSAAGYLRSELARRIKLRTIPQLKFLHDKSLVYGNHMKKLIDDATRDMPDNDEQG